MQELPLLHGKSISSAGFADVAQQNVFLYSIAFSRAGQQLIHYYFGNMNPRILAISGPLQGSEFFIDERDIDGRLVSLLVATMTLVRRGLIPPILGLYFLGNHAANV